ncbi:winged helix DNA-binding domain-containing protein [Streptomyces kanamyceticus]|uniref:Winged helix DNA-binding domain-containing protein n=1 Tax=Streptomyces kanamyceticus TaxID=1967 RepID=A0A5J6G8I8_STRKN|nr:winged helix DNA-binding domain-containing protein [Streptomyces kanamyceticus]QEU90924.1 winged helix DNA-binding domain-containing protein [Streptomyces kanamyceticus]
MTKTKVQEGVGRGSGGSGKRAGSGAPVLGALALNRATLDRQLLLRRSTDLSVEDAVGHLVGLQAQNVKPPYYALAARLQDFDPAELSGLLADRRVVRTVTMRSTIHLHTAEDALPVRQLMQNALERELTAFRAGLVGVDLLELAGIAREAVESEPRTMKQLREVLLVRWPDADPASLAIAARCVLPLVQVTPRGLWRRSGQVALTTAGNWLGIPEDSAAQAGPDAMVLRYLAAFGPASVKDMQTWARLTRLREVFERLRPGLRTFRDENGVELFDLPDAPRPDPDTPAPPRFLPEYDNLLLSHADRTRVVPAEYKGRTWKGNYPYCVFLLDGFLAGLWRLVEDAGSGGAVLVIEPFGKLGRAQRDALTREAERMLKRIAETSTSYDIRFGTVYGTVKNGSALGQ